VPRINLRHEGFQEGDVIDVLLGGLAAAASGVPGFSDADRVDELGTVGADERHQPVTRDLRRQ
jgi:hypothetical protein